MTSARLCFVKLLAAIALLSIAPLHNAAAEVTSLESDQMKVQIDTAFPRVVQYQWKPSGAVLFGQTEPLNAIRINETDYVPKVKFEKQSGDTAIYTLEVPELDITLTAIFQVAGHGLSFTIPEIQGSGEPKVMSIAIPDHQLISVQSTQAGARVVTTHFGTAGFKGVEPPQDFFEALSDKAIDPQPVNWTFAIVHTNQLAATLYGNTLSERNRLTVQTTEKDGIKKCGIGCPAWTWREVPTERFETPYAKVLVASDLNDDGAVDWQDAALAYRDDVQPPFGAELVPDCVVSHIAMNFASWAQHPFLRVLDAMKKVYLYTDGLNQEVQFKGYQAEGHDTASLDYGNHVNRRAGSFDELNFVMKRGKDFNVRSGIHINTTECYPEAKYYSLDVVDIKKRGWAWLDQAHLVDQRYDITSGKLYERLDEMHRALPQTDWVYVDVYFGDGWDAWKLARKLQSFGLPVYTEYENIMTRYTTWNHRSQDWTQQVWGNGLDSRVARFIDNDRKDAWTHSPLLRGSQNDGFMGWHAQHDLNHVIRSIFTVNLPSKYLQHFAIRRFTDHRAELEEGVTAEAHFPGKSEIRRNGKLLNSALYAKDREPPQENLVFIPWDPKNPVKAYHWNDKGGPSTWDIPEEWAGAKRVTLYQLTDLGRVFVAQVPVVDGKIVLDVQAATPYVVYLNEPTKLPEVVWGEGSPVKDPGFDSHSFQWWKPICDDASNKEMPQDTGDGVLSKAGPIQILNDERGQTHLRIAGENGAAGSARQEITLEPGRWYSASVWVEITGNRTAALKIVDATDNTLAETTVEKTAFTNYIDTSDKYLTRFQRIKTVFQMPEGKQKAVFVLRANRGDADAVACFDDARIVETVKPDLKGHAFFEDFENVDEGWGPFVYGYKSDLHTHLSEEHVPFTRDTIDGHFSLKTFMEDDGLNFRSLPALLHFKPNTKYRLSFDYLTQNDGQYEVVVRSDDGGAAAERIASTLKGSDMTRQAFSAELTTGEFGDYYVGFVKKPIAGTPENSSAEKQSERDDRAVLVIDNFAVDEIK